MPARLVVTALLFLFSCLTWAADLAVSLSHLIGSIYVVEDPHYAKTNSVVYVGRTSVTVIGATWSPETARLLANEIRKISDKPITDVIDPSYNPEYSGGNAYWKGIGANIVSTDLTRDLLRSDWQKVGDFVRASYPGYPHVALVLPTQTYPGDFKLEDEDIQALYLGPSHAADDIFVYFPRERVLYAASILKERLGNLEFANLEEYPKTLHKLQQLHLNIDTIISGHWSAIHGPELIDQYLKMLETHSQKRP